MDVATVSSRESKKMNFRIVSRYLLKNVSEIHLENCIYFQRRHFKSLDSEVFVSERCF